VPSPLSLPSDALLVPSPLSLISVGFSPGISEGAPLPALPPLRPLPLNTSASRSARSFAFTYFSSYEYSCTSPPAPAIRSSHCWMSSR
jgi:hypothetical protein